MITLAQKSPSIDDTRTNISLKQLTVAEVLVIIIANLIKDTT